MKLNEFDLVEPPKITDGFYGGRCKPVKLIYDFDNNERRGKYIDVVSLYPTVMYNDNNNNNDRLTAFDPGQPG